MKKLLWNLNQNTIIFIEENAFEMSAILLKAQGNKR